MLANSRHPQRIGSDKSVVCKHEVLRHCRRRTRQGEVLTIRVYANRPRTRGFIDFVPLLLWAAPYGDAGASDRRAHEFLNVFWGQICWIESGLSY